MVLIRFKCCVYCEFRVGFWDEMLFVIIGIEKVEIFDVRIVVGICERDCNFVRLIGCWVEWFVVDLNLFVRVFVILIGVIIIRKCCLIGCVVLRVIIGFRLLECFYCICWYWIWLFVFECIICDVWIWWELFIIKVYYEFMCFV